MFTMHLRIPNLLNAKELAQVDELLAQANLIDGRRTAGSIAQKAKHNLQVDRESFPQIESLDQIVLGALWRHPRIKSVLFPLRIAPPRYSKYVTGMGYGRHVDNAIMAEPKPLRTDLSVTVFLNDPDLYEGGELAIDEGDGEVEFKLQRGDAIIYPSGSPHRVKGVRSGERWAAITWIQSMIPDEAHRRILYDLELLATLINHKQPGSNEALAIMEVLNRLLRLWAQI